MLEDKLLVQAVVWRVRTTELLCFGFVSLEVVVVLAKRCTRTRQRNIYLGDKLLLPCDNILLRVQLVSNVFSMLERLEVLLVCVCFQGLLLVDRVGDCRLTLEHFFHTVFMTFLRHILGCNSSRCHETAWILLAVDIVTSLLLYLTIHFDTIAWLDQILRLYAFVWGNADNSSTRGKIVLWLVLIASIRSDVR